MTTHRGLHVCRRQSILCLAAMLSLAASAAGPQSTQEQSPLTLHVETPLVIEDVVVLDSHNQPVHGLKASDFTVTDNGKGVAPQSFEEHSAPAPAQQASLLTSASKRPDLGVNVFTNYTPVPTNGPLNIILLDALNTPIQDQANVRLQMLKFVASLRPGVPISVYGLSSHLYLLQGFTSDPTVLQAALNAKGPTGSSLVSEPVAAGLDDSDEFLEQSGPTGIMQLENAQAFQAEVSSQQDAQRTQRTLEAIGQLAQYLSTLPGRKNLIWFTGSFPLEITVNPYLDTALNPTMSTSNENAQQFSVAVRATDDELRRSQVAIYPIEAAGILTDSSMNAESPIPGGGLTNQQLAVTLKTGSTTSAGLGPGTGSITRAATQVANFANTSASDYDTMNQMAMETGGKAFTTGGDLKAELASAISLGSNYYTITYTPPSGLWDGKHHRIGIKVDRPGLHLSYRRGYFADDAAAKMPGKRRLTPGAMQVAMLHGGPAPSQLVLDIRVVPDELTTDLLDPSCHPNTKLMKPPYHTYTLDTLLDIQNVQVTRTTEPASSQTTFSLGSGAEPATPKKGLGSGTEEAYQGSLDYAVLVYNANGAVVNSKANSVRFTMDSERYADHLAHGLSSSESIEVPVEGGPYFIRIGIYDPASDRVGALEIPVDALQPKRAMILKTRGTSGKQ